MRRFLLATAAATAIVSCAGHAAAQSATLHVANNAALKALSTANVATVIRDGFTTAGDAPAQLYIASNSACSLNSGAGDDGSQVQSANSKCWLATFGPGGVDAREFGVSYPLNLYAATTGNDNSGANYCTSASHPCTLNGAITKAIKFDAQNQDLFVNAAAGSYDTSLIVAGPVHSYATATSAYTDGSLLVIQGAGSGTTTINPTSGGGGCAQNYGDGITISNLAQVWLDKLTIGTTCTGRSGAFLQNFAYLSQGSDLIWASAPADMVHVEANAYFEVPGASPFNIASGATATQVIAYGTGGIVNFDGGSINLLGNATVTNGFFFGSGTGELQLLTGTTVNLNGHTVTGPKYTLALSSVLLNAADVTIPGSTAGTINGGGVYWSPSTGTLVGSGVAQGGIAFTTADSSHAMIKGSGTTLAARLGDDSNDADFTARAGTFSGNIQTLSTGTILWASRSAMRSTADGNITLFNNATSSFGLLKFGGDTSSFPALKRSSAVIEARLADDSGYAALNAAAGTFNGDVSSTVNFKDSATGSIYWDTRSVMRSPSDGVITLYNNSTGSFDRLQFGGTTSSFPTLKRNGVTLETKLADDSAYTTHTALSFKQSTGPVWSSGSGSPEGVVTGVVGSLYSRTDGGAATTLYVKESGAGNTGWVAK